MQGWQSCSRAVVQWYWGAGGGSETGGISVGWGGRMDRGARIGPAVGGGWVVCAACGSETDSEAGSEIGSEIGSATGNETDSGASVGGGGEGGGWGRS